MGKFQGFGESVRQGSLVVVGCGSKLGNWAEGRLVSWVGLNKAGGEFGDRWGGFEEKGRLVVGGWAENEDGQL